MTDCLSAAASIEGWPPVAACRDHAKPGARFARRRQIFPPVETVRRVFTDYPSARYTTGVGVAVVAGAGRYRPADRRRREDVFLAIDFLSGRCGGFSPPLP